MPDKQKIEEGLDTVIAILTKSNVIAAIAGVAVEGIFQLFKNKGMAVPQYTQAEKNAAMMAAATHVVGHAEELKAKIREEFAAELAGG